MITFLRVKNFAIIDDVEVEFGDGLNVITGETGAGKSILINALSTLMNQKIPADLVKSNVSKAEIVAHFGSEPEEVVLKRVISAAGRSKAFFNTDPTTLVKLEETGASLIHIYGQHELHTLLDKERYIYVIDELINTAGLREELARNVDNLKKVAAVLETKRKEKGGRENEISFLAFQIEEIERANIVEGEEENIRERLEVLKDAERIQACIEGAKEQMYHGEESAYVLLKKVSAAFRQFSHVALIDKMREKTESLSYEIHDMLFSIESFEKELTFDPLELVSLDDRLAIIKLLKSKYGNSCYEIAEFVKKAKERLAYLSGLSEDIESLEKEREVRKEEVERLATELTMKRKLGISPIEKMITRELENLSMRGVNFQISLDEKASIDETGKDEVELLIRTNPGEPLKPVRRIASGGEMSRIMLAIKSVIGDETRKTLVFDEIDAGIGGRVADVVGARLQKLGTKNQIICITHLPQIAIYGDCHYLVEKEQQQETTKTTIRKLNERERILEIARMIGGATITEKTLRRAEEMLHNAEKSTN